ncbi:MAG: hypothetical protein ACHP84_05265 [Caulobacterales bacterium]
MSVRAGVRRLLIALSGVYWIVSLMIAAAIGLVAQHHDLRGLTDSVRINDVALRQAHAQQVGLGAFEIVLFWAAVSYGIVVAGYFTVRWIIRGFMKPG